MISLLLFAYACDREAKMDRLYEVYKLLPKAQQESYNKNWDSYNPIAEQAGFWGVKRDGWHWAKFQMLAAKWLSVTALVLESFLLLGLGYAIVQRLVEPVVRMGVFERRLKHYRDTITTENNFYD
jgi:hypothetical protein